MTWKNGLAALCVILALCCCAALAETQGSLGGTTYWMLEDDGNLSISGEGPMRDFAAGEAKPWSADAVTRVNIGPGITRIGSYAFAGCVNMTSAFGNNVQTVGEGAFSGCTGLEMARLGEELTALESGAFRDCASLESFQWNEGLSALGSEAFLRCYKLNFNTFPTGLTSVGSAAFMDCRSLTQARISGGMTQICDQTFSGCGALRQVSISASVTAIGERAFQGCGQLASVTLLPAVSSVGADAFLDAGLERVYCFSGTPGEAWAEGQDVTVIVMDDANAALPCGAGLTWTLDVQGRLTISGAGAALQKGEWEPSFVREAVMPGTVEALGAYVFADCANLTRVTLPRGLKTIGEEAFKGCASLAELDLPAGLTEIGAYAFEECSALRRMTLPEGLTAVRSGLFYYCVGLEEVSIPSTVAQIDDNVFAYCGALTEVVLPEGITGISQALFTNCYSLTDVRLPDSVTAIEQNAFCDCYSLREVYIPNVESIGMNAFQYCENIVFTSPINATQIAKAAFVGCGFEEIELPEGLTELKPFTFSMCQNMKKLWLPRSLETLADNAAPFVQQGLVVHCYENTPAHTWALAQGFQVALRNHCGAQAEWNLDDAGMLTIRGSGAMTDYAAGESPWQAARVLRVKVKEGITYVGSHAFAGCGNLLSVILPDSVTGIGSGAFADCGRLAGVFCRSTASDAVKDWARSAGVPLLLLDGPRLVLPEQLIFIESQAFAGLSGQMIIDIPAEVEEIAADAFLGSTVGIAAEGYCVIEFAEEHNIPWIEEE